MQKAWAALDVPQCGFCQSGMIMAAAALLASKPKPTDADIDAAMTNICRCGTYNRVRAGIKQAVATGLRRRHMTAEHRSFAPRLPRRHGRPAWWSASTCALPGESRAQTASPLPPEVNAWVVIQPDDRVVIRIARSEMGQGTLTGLAQLVAEELECDWAKVSTE